mgnify:CR=1 FL=1|tara:strand:+ start:115 stop:735 length:621 start_codon:yes stop_codon:yes gene_type:complete
MKLLSAALLLTLSATSSLWSQNPDEVKIDIKGVKTQALQSPEFTVNSGGALKRWKAKEWLEVDIEFDTKLAQSAGGRDGILGAAQVNLYVALQATDEDGKRYVAKASQNFVDISGSDESHVLFFISPATLKRLLKKDNFLPTSDVQGWGVEVLVGGKVLAADSSLGKNPWWQEAANFAMVDGVLVTKNKTPFAPLWHDYDLQVANP